MDNPKSLLFWHIIHTDVDYAALGWALTSSVWAHMLMLLIALTCVYTHPLSVFDDAWLQEQMWANAGRTREKEDRWRQCLGQGKKGESERGAAGKLEVQETVNGEDSFCFSGSVYLSLICLMVIWEQAPQMTRVYQMA